MSTDEYVPSEGGRIPPEGTVKAAFARAHPFSASTSVEERYAEFDRFLARVRRDAWDACYRQMVTAPARGVIVTEKSNPYAPERRVTP